MIGRTMRLIAGAMLGLGLALGASPASASERSWHLGSAERLQVEAPLAVTVTTGAGNAVRATADDPHVLEALEVTVNAGTLLIRLAGNAVRPATSLRGAVTVAVPRLQSVALFADAPVSVAGMRGDRVMLTVTGKGALTVTALDTPQLVATLIGGGSVSLAGRAAEVRLAASGIGSDAGTIDAAGLVTDRLVIQAGDAAQVRAAARSTATVRASAGSVVDVAGNAACTVRVSTDSQVRCTAAIR